MQKSYFNFLAISQYVIIFPFITFVLFILLDVKLALESSDFGPIGIFLFLFLLVFFCSDKNHKAYKEYANKINTEKILAGSSVFMTISLILVTYIIFLLITSSGELRGYSIYFPLLIIFPVVLITFIPATILANLGIKKMNYIQSPSYTQPPSLPEKRNALNIFLLYMSPVITLIVLASVSIYLNNILLLCAACAVFLVWTYAIILNRHTTSIKVITGIPVIILLFYIATMIFRTFFYGDVGIF